MTYPLSLIVTRLQIQKSPRNISASPHGEEYKSIQDAARKIYANEGSIGGFYVGVLSDTTKTIADSFLFFLAYNFLRQSRINSSATRSKYLPVIDELSVGFLAGAASKFLTTPIANVVTRKQTTAMRRGRDGSAKTTQAPISSIAEAIYHERGLQGFWSGYSASLVLTLNPSLTFFFFETLNRLLLPRKQRDNPTAQATFFLAAVSKALASSITYPFSLAKSRLQAGSSEHAEHDQDPKSGAEPSRQKPPTNVFSIIAQIARTEGIAALYEGLHGEVLKGFFSHGITMIIKDIVHRFVIQLYYAMLKLMRRYPSAQELAEMAKNQAETTAANVKDQGQQVVEAAKEGAEAISTNLSHVAGNGR